MGWYCNVIAVDPDGPGCGLGRRAWTSSRSDDGGEPTGDSLRTGGPVTNRRREFRAFVHADQHAIVFHPDFDGASTSRTMYLGERRRDLPDRQSVCAHRSGSEAAICDPGSDLPCCIPATSINGFRYHPVLPRGPISQWRSLRRRHPGQRNAAGVRRLGVARAGVISMAVTAATWQSIQPIHRSSMSKANGSAFRKSIDGGVTFEDRVEGISESFYNFLFISPFVMDPNSMRTRLWTGGRRLWRTDNGAANWTAASTINLGSGQVSALAVAPGQFRICGRRHYRRLHLSQ